MANLARMRTDIRWGTGSRSVCGLANAECRQDKRGGQAKPEREDTMVVDKKVSRG